MMKQWMPTMGTRSPWRVLTAFAVSSMTILASASAANAAPTWLAPMRIGAPAPLFCHDFAAPGAGTYVCDSEIAVTPAGTAYLGQVNFDGTAPAPGSRRAFISIRQPGGSFSSRQALSPAGKHIRGHEGALLDMATNARGDLVMAWAYLEGTRGIVQAAYRSAASGAIRVETVSNTADSGEVPSVGIADDGSAVVIWRNDDAGTVTVVACFLAAGATNFGPFSDISAAGAVADPDVAMAPNGNAVAAWDRGGIIEAAHRPAGQAFAGAVALSAASSSAPDVEIAPNGRSTIVWQRGTVIESRERTITPNFAGGTWRAPGTVTEPGETGSAPAVAVDPDNTAIAVWNSVIAGEAKVRAAVRSSGGSFSDHEPISAPGAQPFAPQVEVSPNRDAVATWALNDGSTIENVESARRPRGGQFGGVDVLMQGTSSFAKGVFFQPQPTVAFDNQGNAFATWVAYTCVPNCGTPTSFNEVAGFDAGPPAFTGVGVPSTTTTGQAVGMSATATDRMTATTLSWNFGDGGGASGGAVSHAYGAPGVYTVTVTARDSVGNASTETRAIQVANPSVGGGDADGDGFIQECNDNDPNIRPNAPEIRGNAVDENCDGVAAPYAKVRFQLAHDYAAFARFTRIVSIQVKKFPRGSTVRATCAFKKKKCPGKAKKAFTKRSARGTVSLNKRYKGVRLRVGTKITVTVTKSQMIGAVKIYTIRGGARPSVAERCLPPGAKKPKKRC